MSQRKTMSEKEFLEKFYDYSMRDYPGPIGRCIDNFLEEHHNNYYEVEFVPCRSKIEIFANEISDISMVRDEDLADNLITIKNNGKLVKIISIE